MKNRNNKHSDVIDLMAAKLDRDIKRIKESYQQRFGKKFELPHPPENDEDSEAIAQKIETLKHSYLQESGLQKK